MINSDTNIKNITLTVNSNDTLDIESNVVLDYTIDNNNNELKVILFTNARDEYNMKEWVAHHLLLGFDFIYIFDHKSKIPLTGLFNNFNKEKFQVFVQRCELEGPIKDKLITTAAKISKKHNFTWMLYLDADEFFVINNSSITDVKSLLKLYNWADSVSFNWLYFGTNYHDNEPKGFLIENYTRSHEFLDEHLKTFIRPTEFCYPNAHRSEVKNKNKIYHGNGTLLSSINPPYYENRHFVNNIHFTKAYVFIAHYYYQSLETFVNRKINLPRDDWGIFRDDDETKKYSIQDIHNNYNDVTNTIVLDKYLNKIKEYLRNIGEL